jgi:mediator of RNA polymerase II transcription subunit 13
VLETYNALSWLNIDMCTGDRRSCLPVHMQALMNMYRSVHMLMPQ